MSGKDLHSPSPPSTARFQWVDSVRGMAIIWITFFHCFLAYDGGFPWPVSISSFPAFLEQCAPDSPLGIFSCTVEGMIAGLFQRGAQGVGVFILFSGFGLTYSLVKRGGKEPAWGNWYRHRLFRLLPIYWLAHLVFLVSPIQYKPDPIDYRFLLSLFGERVYPIDRVFFYLVPAWWFVGMLLQLYIVFPILFRLMQRLGSAKYLALCIAVTSVARYLLFGVLEANGNYIQGGFFACRLWEFAAGMALGKLIAEEPDKSLKWLLSLRAFIGGIFLYALGALTYRPDFLYSFSDGLTALGLSLIMIQLASLTDRVPLLGRSLALAGIYSYSIYLFHQPFIMYAGDKLRPYHLWGFLVLASAITVLIAVACMGVEYSVNRISGRFVRR
ncbi:MAG: acyltransferase family protein [Syntrophobacteraceae bacterium]